MDPNSELVALLIANVLGDVQADAARQRGDVEVRLAVDQVMEDVDPIRIV